MRNLISIILFICVQLTLTTGCSDKNNSPILGDTTITGGGSDDSGLEDGMSFDDKVNQLRRGDIVGNGSGRIETQIYFYYHMLPSIISGALDQSFVPFNDAEKAILNDIADLLYRQRNDANNIMVAINSRKFFTQADGKEHFAETMEIFQNVVDELSRHNFLTAIAAL